MSEPTPSPRVNMDPNFETRLRELRQHAQREYEQRKLGTQVRWDRPQSWSGDVFDYDAMTDPFRRTQANQECVQAISQPESPGVTGDVVAATTMIDTLSCLERAFRNRHTMRRPRAVAHMLGRKKGHGDETGAFGQNGVEYVRNVIQQARAPL